MHLDIQLLLVLFGLSGRCSIYASNFAIAGEFSCEVSYDGKVSIRGVTTTGENTVNRFSQKFEMLSQNLCPPGHFSIYFKLPGPVNPHEFTGSFGTDGILEGIVMKKREE